MRCRFHFAVLHPTVSLILGLALAAIGCQHAPSEDALPSSPSPSASPASAPARVAEESGGSESSSDRASFDGRCVLPTPEIAPPPVPPGPAAGCPPDPESEPRPAPVVHVEFDGARGAEVDAELVRSPHDTTRGLMYRTHLAQDRGMLFDLRAREDHKFWMHNTCIPLDLLFIDFDGLIVGIVENAPTLNDASRSVGCPSRWVLEVNAGWARRHGVRAGQRIELPEAARAPD